jgi:hypothetical protein
MLDFVDPLSTRRRMVDCRCKLWLAELQRHANHLAEVGGKLRVKVEEVQRRLFSARNHSKS